LLGITDANSHTSNFTYDAFGRVTQTTFPSSFYESYAYDAIGNLTSKTDRKGRVAHPEEFFDLTLSQGAALFDWAKPKGAVLDLHSEAIYPACPRLTNRTLIEPAV
jgi:YD repeat-containing protein